MAGGLPEKIVIDSPQGLSCEVVEEYNITTAMIDINVTHKIDRDNWIHTFESCRGDDPQPIKDLYLKIAMMRVDIYFEKHHANRIATDAKE